MSYKDLDLPVNYHPTFDVLDSSKLDLFQECPRRYFYEHILGYRESGPNIHLSFGSAWHKAMDLLHNEGFEEKNVEPAFNAFLEEYRKDFPEHLDDDNAPKNPGNALTALLQYVRKYKDRYHKPLYTEIAGAVPVGEDQVIHFKIDKIIEKKGDLWLLDHKTTGRKMPNMGSTWDIKIQPATYIHAANCVFPDRKVKGIIMDEAIFRRSENEFRRIPVRKGNLRMQEYLWEIRHWIDQLSWNMRELQHVTEDDPVMTAFPKNPAACSHYNSCPFSTLCTHEQPNPLRHMDWIDQNLEKEFWDPREREEEAEFTTEVTGEEEVAIKEN